MVETKDCQLKFRLTSSMKYQINNYCATHKITISDFIRMACAHFLTEEENR